LGSEKKVERKGLLLITGTGPRSPLDIDGGHMEIKD